MTVSETWKAAERRAARFFGAERSFAGSNRRPDRTKSDTTHPDVYIEVKYRERSAARSIWSDADAKAHKEGKVPVVALFDKSRQGFLLVVHEGDFDSVAEARAKAKAEAMRLEPEDEES